MTAKRTAKRPAPRTVEVTVTSGDFDGWSATAKADFRAGWLADLQSGKLDLILPVLDKIVIEHNFPNELDEPAATMADVDPYAGLLAVAEALFDKIGKLPNR